MPEQNQRPAPRNIFEQIAQGLEVTNQNVVALYKMVAEIHAALYPPQVKEINPVPDAAGSGTEGY